MPKTSRAHIRRFAQRCSSRLDIPDTRARSLGAYLIRASFAFLASRPPPRRSSSRPRSVAGCFSSPRPLFLSPGVGVSLSSIRRVYVLKASVWLLEPHTRNSYHTVLTHTRATDTRATYTYTTHVYYNAHSVDTLERRIECRYLHALTLTRTDLPSYILVYIRY